MRVDLTSLDHRDFNMSNDTTKSIKALNIGGKKKLCSREAFEEDIEGRIASQCSLEDVGTFYFVYVPENKHGNYQAQLMFYNDEEGMVHESESIVDHLSDLTSVHREGLARIRETSEPDFALESAEGDKVQVHRSVMEGQWPFFRGMVNSNMQEASDKVVKLDMPKSTLDALVRYLYGERLALAFQDAANLIVSAQLYDLPELVDLATRRIFNESMNITQAVYLWHKSYEADNDELRGFAARVISEQMADMDDINDEVEHLKKNELVTLMHDISVATSKRRKVE
ncbi:hypothetical protein CJU89_6910 [Yarrowia sp. B02]|nr:hypothetical protein CJU89_6910 [Yarrowia sp. B02]